MMEHLTHKEWELLSNSVEEYNVEILEILNKLHPIFPTIATCEHDCNECFKLSHYYYPGEPHHANNNKNCILTIEIDDYNTAFQNNDEEYFEKYGDVEFSGIDKCTCNCTCTNDLHNASV